MADQGRHTKLVLRDRGKWAQKEWVLLGLTCEEVESFYKDLCTELKDLRIAYLDAEHNGEESKNRLIISQENRESIFISADEAGYFENLCSDVHALIINGNHHKGSRQVLFMNDAKKASILRRSEEITHPSIVVNEGKTLSPENYFEELSMPDKLKAAQILEDKSELIQNIRSEIRRLAPLKVLVLAGGKSERMGKDKTRLELHGKEQWRYMAELFSGKGMDTYISCRSEQKEQFIGYPIIEDKVTGIGPLGAILSAFMSDPNSAWLVVATDMPNISEDDINNILTHRNGAVKATTFVHSGNGLPEPLFAIYEPQAYASMLMELSRGLTCPRKFLIKNEVFQIPIENERTFQNLNTPEDLENWKLEKTRKYPG